MENDKVKTSRASQTRAKAESKKSLDSTQLT